jgi:hypothetical protein
MARVIVGKFADRVQAELARASLDAAGIHATVYDAMGASPVFNEFAGGTSVEVDAVDEERAREILQAAERAIPEDTDGETVRCPRCELSYCFFEQPKIARRFARNAPGIYLLARVGSALVAAEKRWCCAKCGHVWDDPDEGPKQMTIMAPGTPRPVFRMKRTQGCAGIMLGVIAGFAAALVSGAAETGRTLLLIVGVVGGWVLGGAMRADVCSEPSCRTPLPRDAKRCPGCKGVVDGEVASTEEHYAAAGDYRRAHAEVTESYREPAAAAKKKAKKKRRVAE